jgi:hypothetical protein
MHKSLNVTLKMHIQMQMMNKKRERADHYYYYYYYIASFKIEIKLFFSTWNGRVVQ